MTYKLRAGAPFDENNIFNRPAVDAGPFVNPYEFAVVAKVDGGNFKETPTKYFDGGTIPVAGTATYDPTITYTENNIVSNEVNDQVEQYGTSLDNILNIEPRVYRPKYILNENPLVTADGRIPK